MIKAKERKSGFLAFASQYKESKEQKKPRKKKQKLSVYHTNESPPNVTEEAWREMSPLEKELCANRRPSNVRDIIKKWREMPSSEKEK